MSLYRGLLLCVWASVSAAFFSCLFLFVSPCLELYVCGWDTRSLGSGSWTQEKPGASTTVGIQLHTIAPNDCQALSGVEGCTRDAN